MANLESSCCDYCCCKGKLHKGGGNFATMILIEQRMATDDVFLQNLWVISLGSVIALDTIMLYYYILTIFFRYGNLVRMKYMILKLLITFNFLTH